MRTSASFATASSTNEATFSTATRSISGPIRTPSSTPRPTGISLIRSANRWANLSTSDFTPGLEQFLGTGAGLSSSTITRLTTQWQTEARAFNERSLADSDYVYVWVDGIHLKVRLTHDKACLLVMIGVRPDGKKELIALADGHRESTKSWADLLRSAKRRGMVAPVLAAGDGALGFCAAVREVFPETKEQRCWFQKIANVLNALSKWVQPVAKAALVEIW